MAGSSTIGGAPWVRQIADLAASVVLFSSPTVWRLHGGEMSSYAPVTLACAAIVTLWHGMVASYPV